VLTPLNIRLPEATDVTEVAGRGANGTVEGHRVTIGAWSYLRDLYPDAAPSLAETEERTADSPGLRAYIAIDGAVVGRVEYADRVRDEARGVVEDLASLGFHRQVLLSGDHPANVEAIASAVGLTESHADFHPQDKARFITDLIASGDRVLMVGDGINDAPALSAANVGVALAAHGGGISAEAADVVLLADHLDRVPEAIRISRRTMRIAQQSIGVGLGLSGIAMIVAALGGMPPAIGAALQEVIDIAVIFNALRTSR
jgi:P-type E1-E2 ATPase